MVRQTTLLSFIEEKYPLARKNTLGINVRARYFASARTEDQIRDALRFAKARHLPVVILGGGSNTVLSDDIDGLVLAVDPLGVAFDGATVEVAAGENWHEFVLESLRHNLFGLENLSLIPGSVGAAPIQNIGAYGVELDRYFLSLDAIDRESLQLVTMDRDDCQFGYRDSIFKSKLKDRMIIVRVRLLLDETFEPNLSYDDLRAEIEANAEGGPSAKELSDAVCRLRRRKLPDPQEIGNVGSFFKNPTVSEMRYQELLAYWPGLPAWSSPGGVKLSAAWMIDQLGLKGSAVGDAQVSTRHALVLINSGHASAADILALAAKVQAAVKARFEVDLEIEPVIYP